MTSKKTSKKAKEAQQPKEQVEETPQQTEQQAQQPKEQTEQGVMAQLFMPTKTLNVGEKKITIIRADSEERVVTPFFLTKDKDGKPYRGIGLYMSTFLHPLSDGGKLLAVSSMLMLYGDADSIEDEDRMAIPIVGGSSAGQLFSNLSLEIIFDSDEARAIMYAAGVHKEGPTSLHEQIASNPSSLIKRLRQEHRQLRIEIAAASRNQQGGFQGGFQRGFRRRGAVPAQQPSFRGPAQRQTQPPSEDIAGDLDIE